MSQRLNISATKVYKWGFERKKKLHKAQAKANGS